MEISLCLQPVDRARARRNGSEPLGRERVGTETSGSILNPQARRCSSESSLQIGRISRYGVIPITADQDPRTHGESVTDAAILLGALESAEPKS
jgi:Asp-tRNA(Asn)/Glu-tRNA(Gln) amidotransferase A subunit family amidase